MLWLLRSLIDDIKAWHRGEVRVASRRLRGRVFAKKSDPLSGIDVKSEPILTISARIQRAGSDKWKNLGEIYKGKP